jgi:pimeloyl-ACP methyl ester carboxylesterase
MTGSLFGLVHGAWHGGWAWSLLQAELEGRGHRVVAPDLPCEDVEAGAVEYARVVSRALGEDHAIVVGHSLGGVTIPLVPARMHVYLCAYVPLPGRALVDRGSEAFGPGFADSAVRDELGRSYWPDLEAAARDLQYPLQYAALAARLRRQARRPSVEQSPLDRLPSTPSAYIVCASDYAIPPEWQRRIARQELGVSPIELDSGHSPMLSCPGELADVLHRLATGRTRPELDTPFAS